MHESPRRGKRNTTSFAHMMSSMLLRSLSGEREDVEGCEESKRNPDISVSNLCDLSILDEETILETLDRRFSIGKYYTFANHICIAVNPYKATTRRASWENRNAYLRLPQTALEPHVYAISGAAMKGIFNFGRDQSIVVNGESGAGKTETIKLLLSHITEMSDGQALNEVLKTSAVLESFGNAATARNDNSSRFGILFTLSFAEALRFEGSQCTTYLLEKCRVVQQGCNDDERNFHAFYELLCAPDEVKQCVRLSGQGPQDFRYTQRAALSAQHAAEYSARFMHSQDALRSLLGRASHSAEDVHAVLSMVLLLGESLLRQDGTHALCQGSNLTNLSLLLGLETAALEDCLCHRHVDIAGSTIRVPLSAEQFASARDALAKEIYARLFAWLVETVNASRSLHDDAQPPMCSPVQPVNTLGILPRRSIGLLDIFGFETFTCNRFEQLCINYANEALQQRFSRDAIVSVQAEYEAEGVPWAPVPFSDNAAVLELLHGRLGVFATLNEEGLVPGGSEAGFVSKLCASQRSCAVFRVEPARHGTFSVQHYAGRVTYDTTAFLAKNRDAFYTHTSSLMAHSKNDLVSQLFQTPRSATSTLPAERLHVRSMGTKAVNTICSKFRAQLETLLQRIDTTQVQFVRCLKPNSTKSSSTFDRDLVAQQLRSGGLVEAVRVIRSAYPHKLSHADCRQLCRALGLVSGVDCIGKAAASALEEFLRGSMRLDIHVGASRVYFVQGSFDALCKAVAEARCKAAVLLQSWGRGCVGRRRYSAVLRSVVRVQAFARGCLARGHRRNTRAATVVQTWVRMVLHRAVMKQALCSIRQIQAAVRLALCRASCCKQRSQAAARIQHAAARWLRSVRKGYAGCGPANEEVSEVCGGRCGIHNAATQTADTEEPGTGFQSTREQHHKAVRELRDGSTQTAAQPPPLLSSAEKRRRRRQEDRERIRVALQDVRDCFPPSLDLRTWTAEGVQQLLIAVFGFGAVALLRSFE